MCERVELLVGYHPPRHREWREGGEEAGSCGSGGGEQRHLRDGLGEHGGDEGGVPVAECGEVSGRLLLQGGGGGVGGGVMHHGKPEQLARPHNRHRRGWRVGIGIGVGGVGGVGGVVGVGGKQAEAAEEAERGEAHKVIGRGQGRVPLVALMRGRGVREKKGGEVTLLLVRLQGGWHGVRVRLGARARVGVGGGVGARVGEGSLVLARLQGCVA